jgi:hypothetical protein
MFCPGARSLSAVALVLALCPAFGCGDGTTQNAGTIDLPERKVGPFDSKSFAKDAVAKPSPEGRAR